MKSRGVVIEDIPSAFSLWFGRVGRVNVVWMVVMVTACLCAGDVGDLVSRADTCLVGSGWLIYADRVR